MEKPYPTLSNAPISEAIINIRFTAPDVIKPEVLDRLAERVSDEYPNKEFKKQGTFRLEIGTDSPNTEVVDEGVVGVAVRNRDNTEVIQFMRDQFTLSRLHPYVNWGELRDKAKQLWELTRENIQPVDVYRIAVRYINRIEIPFGSIDLDDYMTAAPQIPEALPQDLASYLTKVVMLNDSISAAATVHQVFEGMTPNSDGNYPDTFPIILDIDAVKSGIFDPNTDQMWEEFEYLREYKNDIFFHSLTDKALEPYL